MSIAKALYARWRVLVHELAKFGIVGAINTVVHFGLANLIVLLFEFEAEQLTANGIALVVAATTSYFMNRAWTFKHRARSGVRREYTLFFVLNGVGWLLSQACLAFTIYVLDMHSLVAMNASLVVGVGLGTIFRFTTYKRWVFLAPPVDPVPAGTGAAGGGSELTGIRN